MGVPITWATLVSRTGAGSISRSPLYPSFTIYLYVRIAADLHQSLMRKLGRASWMGLVLGWGYWCACHGVGGWDRWRGGSRMD